MTNQNQRREFLKAGSIAATGTVLGSLLGGRAKAEEAAGMKKDSMPMQHGEHPAPSVPADLNVKAELDGFLRFKPSRGNDPDSDYYLGKLMPGFRSASAGPAPFLAPDLEKLSWKMVGGAKEFHLIPMAVQREFLPGYNECVRLQR